MTASGFGALDKVSKSGDTMTGALNLQGSTPMVVPTATNGQCLVSDGSGNFQPNTPGLDYFNCKNSPYGAKGDGVTNDTAAIQAAVNACNTAGGGVVYLPAGTYKINSRITPKIGVTVQGAGIGKTILKSGGTGDYVFYTKDATNGIVDFTVQDLTINVNNQTAQSAIRLEYATRCNLRRLRILNVPASGWGVVFGASSPDSTTTNYINTNCLVEDCFFDTQASTLEMMLIMNTQHIRIVNCDFYNNSVSNGPGLGIYQVCDDVKVEGCTFRSIQGPGIYYSLSTNNIVIHDCSFYGNNSGTGILGANLSDNGSFGSTWTYGLTVTDCYFTGWVTGLQLGAVKGASVDNCFFDQNYNIGLIIKQGGSGVSAMPLYWTITNCRFRGNNQQNTSALIHPAILLSGIGGSQFGKISQCSIWDDAGTPTQTCPITFSGAFTWDYIAIDQCYLQQTQNATIYQQLFLDSSAVLGSNVLISNSRLTDGTTVIVKGPTSSKFNVKEYGAKGDGSHDDTSAIQAAMNAAGPTGATVVFPPGNYMISNHLLWDTTAQTTAQLAPSLEGSPGMGGPSIDAAPGIKMGVVQLTATSGFPIGEFMIDYLGPNPSGGAAGNTGFRISGFVLQCVSRAAGIRSFNSEDCDWNQIVINNAAAPAPANTAGSPIGAFNFVANPSFQAWNNRCERVYVVECARHAFYLNEGTGSFIFALNCMSVNAGWSGFYALHGVTLQHCLAQGSGVNNPDSGFYYAEWLLDGATMVGCQTYGNTTGPKGPGINLEASSFPNVISDCIFVGNKTASLAEKYSSVVWVSSGGATQHHTTFSNCYFNSITNTSDYVNIDSGSTGDVRFVGCHFLPTGAAPGTHLYNANGTNILSFHNCEGINPAGTQTVSVPATGVATTALPFKSTFYVTAGASGTTTMTVSGGPAITVPASSLVAISVPAGQTLTPTYTAAPTWVVEGE